MNPRGFLLLAVAAPGLCATPSVCRADGTLQGHARYEKVTGRSYGWNELYEYYINVCPDGPGSGQRYRAGSPPGQVPIGDGSFEFTLPAGRYSLLSSQPKFAWRGKVVSDITIADGQTTYRDAITPQDYSVAFGGNSSEWGTDPWTSWANTFAQTFVATGTSITRASFKLAGKDAGDFDILVSIRDGGPSGAQIGPARRVAAGAGGDAPVAWRSGEVPTVPGQTYAVRFASDGGQNFAFYARTDNGDGYAQGTAYVGATAIGADLYACIGSDNDGTVIPYCKITNLGNLPLKPGDGWWATDFGQTFRATASSLAAVEGFAVTGNTYPSITWEIRQGGPSGPIVGPVKSNQTQFQAGGVDHMGVVYNPGEVPLIPGQTYYIRCTASGGMHFLVFESGDAYPYGQAYESGGAHPDTDLYMTIYEYVSGPEPGVLEGTVTDPSGNPIAGATVTLSPGNASDDTDASGAYRIPDLTAATYDATVVKAGYATANRSGIVISEGETRTEDFVLEPLGAPGQVNVVNPGFETGDLTGWTAFGSVDGVHDSFFGGITAYEGTYFLANGANWGIKNGGVYQTVDVTPGYEYRFSAFYYLNWDGKTTQPKPDVRLAVDPTGGTDINGPSVVYSPWGTAGYAWTEISFDFTASGGRATIFLQMRQRDSTGWNINAFDAVTVDVPDTDEDGIPDFYETAHSSILDPNDPDDAGQDGDGDLSSNLEEFRVGTDPEDGNSYFRVTRVDPSTSSVTLEWTGTPPFRVWRKDGPAGAWSVALDDWNDTSCTLSGVGTNDWYRVEPIRD